MTAGVVEMKYSLTFWEWEDCIWPKQDTIQDEIPLLRPPKIKTFGQLKTLFAKFRLFVSSFSSPSGFSD